MGIFDIFKKKDKQVDIFSEDVKQIKLNTSNIDVLITYAKPNEKVVKRLEEIKTKLQYLSPSNKENVYEMDKKIFDYIYQMKEDFRQMSNTQDFWDADKQIRDLEVLIDERNAN